ncbi:hypothetical protein Agabi119p4_7104 [Agaricus bisporus var. burnettii]|uniref:Potassium channel domain-containing protein n=1 Tax=Agaricus bisporus var. burnettii TaxID=192524 RepID=A0A8H7C6L7_AGABI|nr:hypothetical protein Agabi119p4_7104 [Agaricus bisporus var. burnettii]
MQLGFFRYWRGTWQILDFRSLARRTLKCLSGSVLLTQEKFIFTHEPNTISITHSYTIETPSETTLIMCPKQGSGSAAMFSIIRFKGDENRRLSREEAVNSSSERHFAGSSEEKEREYYQPAVWWFASFVFPLVASALGPIACLLAICALVHSWLTSRPSGAGVINPGWILALEIVSLVFALLANLLLLFNFAKRISYNIAQPLTIISWYTASAILLVPVIVTHKTLLHRQPSYMLSESYYSALIAVITYFVISTLLLVNFVGSYVFHAYPLSFAQLDRPQRTLMLQTITFSVYLAIGGAIFSSIESWDFVEGVYWADHTVLTIGFGAEFPLTDTAGRMALIPFVAVGLLIIGLIVNSIRLLVIEHARGQITRRLHKERKKWHRVIEKLRNGTEEEANEAQRKIIKASRRRWKQKMMITHEVMEDDSEKKRWRIWEFILMRHIEEHSRKLEGYIALASSFLVFGIVWIGGSAVFWVCQLRQDPVPWTYPESLYFTYTSILTIGYGDFHPSTTAAKPFCVIWSLLAIPCVTVLIQNIGETVAGHVENGVEWLGSRSILPEDRNGNQQETEQARNEDRETDGGRGVSIRMLPIGKRRKRKPDKGKGRSVAQVEDGRGAPFEPQLSPHSGTRRQPAEIPSLLSVRLSREIIGVSRDAAKNPTIKYTWHEWVQWLRLMDEAQDLLGVSGCHPHSEVHDGRDIHDDQQWHQQEQQSYDCTDGRTRPRVNTTTTTILDRWRCGWLDDGGPLFSSMTETQWLLERVGRLFEGVVAKESEVWRREGDESEREP